MIPIGNTLRELRQSIGYQQADVIGMLADIGIVAKQPMVSRWENNRNLPTVEQFVGLCKLYGVKDVYKVFVEQDFSELVLN